MASDQEGPTPTSSSGLISARFSSIEAPKLEAVRGRSKLSEQSSKTHIPSSSFGPENDPPRPAAPPHRRAGLLDAY
ncbi:hypothetical protein GGTG_08635 [Gaeumannomyces tritici R3-111a-1]|uniref:Uncharacterized protein n=1 Tax=Gaeumannomyces tritici (strain R3-111a-1) TaxID=644352 RepID=J3P549_GAET3|nr:hypothetical protein GGTG_08635 [Gaeumannomyces tritici R3-111a-1]EJT74797.1 hypothetical protein GGTG_08635 [Gaeumannomyces tritici R3-111a-1]